MTKNIPQLVEALTAIGYSPIRVMEIILNAPGPSAAVVSKPEPESEPEPEPAPKTAKPSKDADKGARSFYSPSKRGLKANALVKVGNPLTTLNAIRKAPGHSKRYYMLATGLTLKATESAIYALQTMGLIDTENR